MDSNPTETTEVVSETPTETTSPGERDAETSRPSLASRVSAWRKNHAVSAETVADQRRLLETRQRDEETRQRDAAHAAARRGRKAAADRQDAAFDDDVQAPIPLRMQIAGIWADRSIGGLQRLAPLVVSGFFTMDVGMDKPLDMGWEIALAFTLSLEGSLWHLQRLRERFRLEGDGTFSLALAIYGIIALIFALICGHAIWKANGSVPIDITVPGMNGKVPLSDVVPAVAVALMSAIGTFVWAKTAAFKHRAKLRAQGRLDAAAPKFAVASWFFCPWETFWSLRHAVKYKLSSPLIAVEDWRLWKMTNKPSVWPAPFPETLEIETPETSRRERPLRVVSTTGTTETSQPSLVSGRRLTETAAETSRRLAAASHETSRRLAETAGDTRDDETIVSGPSLPEPPVSAPPVSAQEDIVETVGRLHLSGVSYKDIGDRLGMAKATAGRHGATFYKRNGASLSAAAAE